MEEDKTKEEATESKSIDEILRERERLTQVIEEKFKQEVTILFTDICGYTKYMETKGDISGRNMLQKHNDIVMPLVDQHNGVVIKTIGDAIMATFEDSLEGVKAAVGIQKGLSEYNRKTEVSNRIHVKIGVNTGDVLVDEGDVFGDAVNVAARIQGKAGKDDSRRRRFQALHAGCAGWRRRAVQRSQSCWASQRGCLWYRHRLITGRGAADG